MSSTSTWANAALCASIGAFVGLVITLLWPAAGTKQAIADALLGSFGGLLMAWFISPITDSANDRESLSIAAILAAFFGALALVTLGKAIRGK